MTLASHKAGGPVGTGALVVRAGVALRAQQVGGGQERDRRSGTQDVVGAIGMAAAATAAARDRSSLVVRATRWRDELAAAILRAVPGAVESAVPSGADRSHLVAGIVHVCLPAVDSEALLYRLEHDHQVLASAASSCASGAQEPSHVLSALGHRPRRPRRVRCASRWVGPRPTTTSPPPPLGVADAARRLQAHARHGAPA